MSKNSWSIDISDEGCMGCGLCYTDAPEFFGQDSFRIAYIKKQPQDFFEEEVLNLQMDSCPVSAIKNGFIDERL